MRRRVVSLMLLGVMLLSGCSADLQKDTTHPKELNKAIEKLASSKKDYIVQTYLDAPDSELYYLEVCGDGYSYTEYPIDADGNVGTVDSDEVQSFMLTDWVSDSGAYLATGVGSELTTGDFLELPKSYVKLVEDRRTMNLQGLSNEFYNIELEKTEGDVKYYAGKLSAKGVRELLGVGSEGFYKCLLDDAKKGSDEEKLIEYFIEDADMNLIFSEANILIGVENGLPTFFNVEVGGLGTRLYLYKELSYADVTPRDTPDFSSSTPYIDTMKETAATISDCKTNKEIGEKLRELNTETTEATNQKEVEEVEEQETSSKDN